MKTHSLSLNPLCGCYSPNHPTRSYIHKKSLLLIVALLCGFLTVNGQLVYYNASVFPLLGKISDSTETRYERLPSALKETVRPPVWSLGKNTAGLAVRFSSNSSQIAARWELLADTYMNHMTAVGMKGLDLYCLQDGKWKPVNSARPTGKQNTAIIAANMEPIEREYLLYLPLYDGVISLAIGVDSLAFISQPKIDLPKRTKPVVCYGTSILQGGCASRAGMAHTNILSRWFNREFINLGFSGNGQLDYEIAELMSHADASVFVLDFMPNVNAKQVEDKLEHFYQILRNRAANTPIVFIENPMFPQARLDTSMRKVIEEKNAALRRVFDQLKAKGDGSIWLVPSAGMIGLDDEATVDGIHFTDLGFMRYAEYLFSSFKSMPFSKDL